MISMRSIRLSIDRLVAIKSPIDIFLRCINSSTLNSSMHSGRLFPVDSIEIGVRYRSQNELAKEKKFMSIIGLIATFFIFAAVTVVILAGMMSPKLGRLDNIDTILEERKTNTESNTEIIKNEESWVPSFKSNGNRRTRFTNNLNEIINNFNIIHQKRIDSVTVKKKNIVGQMERMIKILKTIKTNVNINPES